jgi:transcriptional regulator with XRE-family HTH domain
MTLLEATRKRINELCIVKNMNINQLAINSGINPSTIRSIFKIIKKAPSSETIYYICIGFGISIKDFYNSKLFDELDDD